MALTADVAPQDMGGLTGWVASVIDPLGAPGVGLMVALENLIPPIPSEVVLPLAGYLAGEGRMNVVFVLVMATLGSVGGALLLYWLGAVIGEDRLRRWLDHVPFVDREDLDKADRWFERHGKWAVLFGRMVPVVRSLVSVPAGAERMPVGQFIAFTALGSGIWNSMFVGLGFALGSQWQQIATYSRWFDYVIGAFLAFAIVSWFVKGVRRRRARQSESATR